MSPVSHEYVPAMKFERRQALFAVLAMICELMPAAILGVASLIGTRSEPSNVEKRRKVGCTLVYLVPPKVTRGRERSGSASVSYTEPASAGSDIRLAGLPIHICDDVRQQLPLVMAKFGGRFGFAETGAPEYVISLYTVDGKPTGDLMPMSLDGFFPVTIHEPGRYPVLDQLQKHEHISAKLVYALFPLEFHDHHVVAAIRNKASQQAVQGRVLGAVIEFSIDAQDGVEVRKVLLSSTTHSGHPAEHGRANTGSSGGDSSAM